MPETMDELDTVFETFSEEKGFENILLKYKIHEVIPFIQGPSLLYIGCCVGFLFRALSRRVESVVGLDISPAKIAWARALNAAPNISYVCVGENSIISSNSVVTETISPRVLALGAPARVIGELRKNEIRK